MNQESEKLLKSLPTRDLSALEISGDKWNRQSVFRKYQSVEFPQFDVCQDVLDERFELIIAEQVFEHLLWPYRAGRNIFAMLSDGGYFFISTPFLVRIHRHPVDCSRWTETGLKYFLAECGFPLEKVQTFSWGNRSCVKSNLGHWQIYQPWRHSLANEIDFPLAVWAIAQK
jgi:hypothetical protein